MLKSPCARIVAFSAASALGVVSVIGCGAGASGNPSTGSSSAKGEAASAAPPSAQPVSPAPRFMGPGTEGEIVVLARKRSASPSADLYRLAERPLKVRRLTSTPEWRGLATYHATRGGAVVSNHMAADRRQQLNLLDLNSPDGLGRRIGVGFDGAVAPDRQTVAVMRRSPNPSGLPIVFAVKSARGGERVVLKERRDVGPPSWTSRGDLVVPVVARSRSFIYVNPGTPNARKLSLPSKSRVTVLVAGPSGALAASDHAARVTHVVNGSGRLVQGPPLRDLIALDWSKDGRSLLGISDEGRRLEIVDVRTRRRTLIASVPDGEIYHGSFGVPR